MKKEDSLRMVSLDYMSKKSHSRLKKRVVLGEEWRH